ncbi:hypothetical protein AB8L92_01040 [Klebsiella quasipneumoniae]
MALAAMDSSESIELPLDYLQGHKDGLEWAAQLAEANHPETGDWLYDDPIELAKAIRKGPDMPPAQPAADSEPDRNPVLAYADSYRDMAKQGVESVPIWSVITDLERNIAPLYRHAQQPTVTGNGLSSALSLTQMQIDWICNTCATIYHTANDDVAQGYIDEIRATLERMKSIDTAQQPVVPDELNTRTANDVMNEHLGWKDYGDAEVFCIAWNACRAAMLQAGNSPAIPDGYVMVPKEPTEEMLAAAKEWTGLTSTAEVVYIKMLAAAQQEVKGE